MQGRKGPQELAALSSSVPILCFSTGFDQCSFSFAAFFIALCNPRFGRALATVRTRNMRAVKAAAKSFLKRSSKTGNDLDRRPRINSHWLKHAQLMPVLEFLSRSHLKL